MMKQRPITSEDIRVIKRARNGAVIISLLIALFPLLLLYFQLSRDASDLFLWGLLLFCCIPTALGCYRAFRLQKDLSSPFVYVVTGILRITHNPSSRVSPVSFSINGFPVEIMALDRKAGQHVRPEDGHFLTIEVLPHSWLTLRYCK
ncbi:hypothetical protein LIN78_03595 [Leeia sp. TBRC 13508]|uniref:Uncharacterized protein n=1 Tax=Leeia speluncae TaxID=2884804 RepID=A0ABS8D384_9NEIS|nr:hypothetical protein [Leeia speluncae]MCB6182635.1 hypothetical protein [Leeia speluncae]